MVANYDEWENESVGASVPFSQASYRGESGGAWEYRRVFRLRPGAFGSLLPRFLRDIYELETASSLVQAVFQGGTGLLRGTESPIFAEL